MRLHVKPSLLRTLGVALPILATACKAPDPRLPTQPQAPTTAHVQSVEPAPAPAPAPATPVEAAPDNTAETGPDVAARMLEAGDATAWDDVAAFTRYCKDSIASATTVRTALQQGIDGAIPTIEAFDGMEMALDTLNGLSSLLFNVSPNKAVRDAAETCRQDISKFTTETSLDRRLYDALERVDRTGLDADTVFYVEKMLRDFRRAGVGKDEATRTRIAEINAELVKLSQEYSKAINSDVRKVLVSDATELDGMPSDWMDAHKPDAEGRITITTDYPDLFPVQNYAKSPRLRKELYEASASRAFPGNVEILRKILKLRAEFATLLEHPNWADYITADKMSGSAAAVEQFIKDIHAIIRPRAETDLKALLARKQKDFPDATAIEVHDRFYYMNLLRKEQGEFDAQEARKYFGYTQVKDGIFELYGRLFGLEFKRLPEVRAWHPQVEAWEMRRQGQLVGRFFLDMHPRADKYKHAAMFTIQSGLREGRIPWASLVCNFPDPGDGSAPALMEHRDVQTFFHEFGHLIHQLLARQSRWLGVSGISVEWDFVEAPSQLLEEWAWNTDVLQGFARHVETRAPIPAELVEKMKNAEEFGKGVDLLRQVYLTAYSFFMHVEDPEKLDFQAFTKRMYESYAPFPMPENDHLYANFGHLMGYSAIYYTYQWSLAIAKDLYTRFEKAGIMDAKVAAEYAAKILEPGGTRKAADMVTDFLGRERNLDAYRRWIEGGTR
jgi:thimet oligopeptidase